MWSEPEWTPGASSSFHRPRERTLLSKVAKPSPGPASELPLHTARPWAWAALPWPHVPRWCLAQCWARSVCRRNASPRGCREGPLSDALWSIPRGRGRPPRETLPSVHSVPSARWLSSLITAGTVVLGHQSCLGDAAACSDLDARGDLLF